MMGFGYEGVGVGSDVNAVLWKVPWKIKLKRHKTQIRRQK